MLTIEELEKIGNLVVCQIHEVKEKLDYAETHDYDSTSVIQYQKEIELLEVIYKKLVQNVSVA